MTQVIRFRGNCVREQDVVAADRDAVRSVVKTPRRIRKVCELLLRLKGIEGHVTVESGAELGDGVMEFFAELHQPGDADGFDGPAFWGEVRRCLGAETPDVPPKGSTEIENDKRELENRRPDPTVPEPGPTRVPPDGWPPEEGGLGTKPVDDGYVPFDPFDEEFTPPPIELVGVERRFGEDLCIQIRPCLLIQLDDSSSPPILIELRPHGGLGGNAAGPGPELEYDRQIEVGMNISDLMADAVVKRSGIYLLSEYEVLPDDKDE